MRNTHVDSGSASSADAFPGWAPRFAEALQRLSIPERQRAAGSRHGDARSATHGRAHEFADYRPYASGDDPKLVDWRVYARSDRLFLKQHDEERARTVSILVDVSASMDLGAEGDGNWGTGDWVGANGRGGEQLITNAHKGAYARRLAAAFAWIAVSHHEAVAIWLLRDGSARRLNTVSSRAGVITCFRDLASVQEEGGAGLEASVRQAVASRTRGPTVLISDLLEADWAAALATLCATGDAMVIQPLAPSEWSPPIGDEVELLDAESGTTLATRLGTSELADYDRHLRDFLGNVSSECRRLGLPYAAVNTGTELQDVLFRQLPAAGILE